MLENLSKGAAQAGIAIEIARRLETTLETVGATGKGLHEKADSVEAKLPAPLVKKLRFVASVRNKIVHEDDLLPDDDFSAFSESGQQAIAELEKVVAGGRAGRARSKTKAQKAVPDPDRADKALTMARTGGMIRLAATAFLGGVVLVFLLMALGSDGPGLWIGAFSIYFVLGWQVLRKSRQAAP